MYRLLPALMLLCTTASAQEFQSEEQDLHFEGQQVVLDSSIPIAFPIEIDLLITEVTITPGLEIYGQSVMDMVMDATSQLRWPFEDGIEHVIEPVEGSGRVSMQSSVGFTIDLGIEVESYAFNIELLADEYDFDIEVQDFLPFLLEGQDPSEITLDSSNEDLQFELPIDLFSVSLYVVSVTPSLTIEGQPELEATVMGDRLVTENEDDRFVMDSVLEPSVMYLYDNPGYLDLTTEYEVETVVDVGYTISVDGEVAVTLDFLGDLDLGSFGFDIWEETFPVFFGSETIEFDSQDYRHPLPALDLPLTDIEFARMEAGESATYQVGFFNDGQLELMGWPEVQGDPAFTVGPPELFAVAGGLDEAVVTFEPLVEGEYEAELVFYTSDPLQPEVRIPLIGKVDVATSDPNGGGGDNDPWNDNPSTIYTICGCSTGLSPVGGWASLLAVGLLWGVRRRD